MRAILKPVIEGGGRYGWDARDMVIFSGDRGIGEKEVK